MFVLFYRSETAAISDECHGLNTLLPLTNKNFCSILNLPIEQYLRVIVGNWQSVKIRVQVVGAFGRNASLYFPSGRSIHPSFQQSHPLCRIHGEFITAHPPLRAENTRGYCIQPTPCLRAENTRGYFPAYPPAAVFLPHLPPFLSPSPRSPSVAAIHPFLCYISPYSRENVAEQCMASAKRC
jgi:hypothetical protein